MDIICIIRTFIFYIKKYDHEILKGGKTAQNQKNLFFYNRLPFLKTITTTKRKTMQRKTRMPTSISQMKTRLRARRGNPRTDVRFTARTRTRSAGTGPEDWISSCRCWDTAWGWGTSGGSPTCVIGTAEGRFCCHL